MAKAKGAYVIATATGDRDIGICKSFGADHVIDYMKTPVWEAEVNKLTSGRGVDVTFDPIGVVSQSIKCTAFSGRVICIGFVGGQIEAIKVNRVLLKNIAVVGLHWGAYTQHDPQTIPKVWAGLFQLVNEGKFKPTVWREASFSGLESIPSALKTLERKESYGKVVVDISGDTKSKL